MSVSATVYYEIGYAHALGAQADPIQTFGYSLHFDLSVHNVFEYKNATELRRLLTRRLEEMTGCILSQDAPTEQ